MYNHSGIEYVIDTYFQSNPCYKKGYSTMPSYTNLESLFFKHTNNYSFNSYSRENNYAKKEKEYYFIVGSSLPNLFLNPCREEVFVNNSEVINITNELFELMLGRELKEVNINICNDNEFFSLNSAFNQGVLGFAINNKRKGKKSSIYVRKADLATMLIVIAHELGHVFTNQIEFKSDEEAKAFAFALEWVKLIKKHNISGLADSINLDFKPAKNNLHDVSFNFVKSLIDKGYSPIGIHWDIVKRYLSIEGWVNV